VTPRVEVKAEGHRAHGKLVKISIPINVTKKENFMQIRCTTLNYSVKHRYSTSFPVHPCPLLL